MHNRRNHQVEGNNFAVEVTQVLFVFGSRLFYYCIKSTSLTRERGNAACAQRAALMVDFGDFSFKAFVFSADLFGKFYLLRSEAIAFKQIVAHSFVSHEGVAVEV